MFGAVNASGVGRDELPIVLDKLTTYERGRAKAWIGLINVNTASAATLATVPNLEPDLAQRIVDTRGSLSNETRSTTGTGDPVAWSVSASKGTANRVASCT